MGGNRQVANDRVQGGRSLRSWIAGTAAGALVAGMLVVAGVGVNSAAADAWAPTVDVESQSSGGKDFVLAGEDATFRVSARNTDGGAQFNLGFTALLPTGVTFVSGGEFGEPTQFAAGAVLPNSVGSAPADCVATGLVAAPVPPGPAQRCAVPAGKQLWVWSNVNDLPQGGTVSADVRVRPDAAQYPVGSTIDFDVAAYTSNDPTLLPVFDGSPGKSKETAHTSGRGTDASRTPLPVKPLRVTKTENGSPEHELLRGVHDNVTTYTIRVENTGEAATEGVTVVDYLPAGLEYLGVATGPGNSSAPEYPGAPPVSAATAGERVETVQLSASEASALGLQGAGVYTKVTWTIGTMSGGTKQTLPDTPGAPGSTEITYRAAVPLFENAMWPAGAEPDPATGAQAGNLDNNIGASTRQGVAAPGDPAGGKSLVNAATASGTYTGPLASGASADIADSDTAAVEAVDLRVVKSVADSRAFETGTLATYTLDVATGEYADASDIVLTDVIPNGLCPAFPEQDSAPTLTIRDGGTVTDLSSDPASWSSQVATRTDCDYPNRENGARLDGAALVSIEYDKQTGEFAVQLGLEPVAAQQTRAVTYTVMQRHDYTGGKGGTSSGDVLTNRVSITGTTKPIAAIGNDPSLSTRVGGDYAVKNTSSAVIHSDFSGLAKEVLDRGFTPSDAAAASHWSTHASTPFSPGDRVWYRVSVNFADGIDTRNPHLDDYLPVGVEYSSVQYSYDLPGVGAEPGRVAQPSGAAADYIPAVTVSGSALSWELGSKNRSGSNDRFMPKNSVLTVYVEGIVTDQSASRDDVDRPDNHAKFQQTNVDGELYFLRREAGIDLDWGATLKKGIREVASGSTTNVVGAEFGQRSPTQQVAQGDRVEYRIDVTAPQNGTRDYVIWDVLPKGVKAADVSAFNAWSYDGGGSGGETAIPSSGFSAQAYDPADIPAGGPQPSTAYADRSVVIWNVSAAIAGSTAGDDPVARGLSLGYTLTVPNTAQVTQSYENTAGIVSYAIPNSGTSGATTVVPQQDGAAGQQLTNRTPGTGEVAMSDEDTVGSAEVHLRPATVTKKLVSTEVRPAGSAPADPNNTGTRSGAAAGKPDDAIAQGEYATFEYAATIPAHTSVAKAKLFDDGSFTRGTTTIPYEFVAGSAKFYKGATGTAQVACGAANDADAFRCDQSADGKNGVLTFPDLYTNSGDEDEVFRVQIVVWVKDRNGTNLNGLGNYNPQLAQDDALVNTAVLGLDNPNPGGSARITQTGTAQVKYVEPSPTLSKAVGGVLGANGEVTFTLTAGNAASRPALYDAVVYDCLPAGFSLPAQTFAPSAGTVDPVAPAVKCSITGSGSGVRVVQPDASGTGTLIKWNVGRLDGGSSATLSFKAIVDQQAAGGLKYTNSAQIAGYTLPDTLDDAASRRGDRVTGVQRDVQIAPATLVKGVSPAQAPVGETVRYTLTTTIPANANYYFADLSDSLPAGVEYVPGSAQVVFAGGPAIADEPSVSGSVAAGQKLVWSVEDDAPISTSTSQRTIRITYDAKIRDTVTSAAPANTAVFSWNTNPEDNEAATRQKTPNATAIVTIQNPNLTLQKQVKLLGAADGTYAAAKTGNPDQGFTYRVRVTNTGNASAYHAKVTDCLPAGVVDVTSVSASGSYDSTPATGCPGGTITWTDLGPIAAGGTLDLTYNAKFAPSSALEAVASPVGTGKKLDNTAKVDEYASFGSDGWVYRPGASGKPGQRPGGAAIPTTNTSSTAGVTPLFPNVVPAKTVTSPVSGQSYGLAYADQPFNWTLTMRNTGAGAAKDVAVTDTLPVNWEYAGNARISVNGGAPVALADPALTPATVASGDQQKISWSAAQIASAGATPLAAGGAFVITFDAKPLTAALTTPGTGVAGNGVKVNPHTNTLSVRATDTSGADRNKTVASYSGADSTATAYLGEVDLKLVKKATGGTTGNAPADHPLHGVPKDQWVIGQAVESGVYTQPQWVVTVDNHGPDVAHGPFVVTDTPASPAGVTIGTWNAYYVSGAGNETLIGSFSGSGPFTVGTDSTTLQPNGSDRIVLRANVTVGASAAPDSTAGNEASVDGRTYEPEDKKGPNAANPNTDGDSRQLIDSADLQVAKTVGPAPNAGGSVTWTITPQNNGPSVSRNSAAKPITVSDTIPAGVGWVADPSNGMWTALLNGAAWPLGTQAKAGDEITFVLNPGYSSLPVGAQPPIALSGTVDPGWTPASGPGGDGSIVNTAVIAPGGTVDPKTPNNTSTVSTTPTFNTTLGVSKVRVVQQGGAWVPAASLTPVPQVHAGDPVHYLITVSNNGSAVARNVTVTDEVPAGLTYSGFEDVSPASWSRSAHTTAPWDLFSLTSDGSTLPVGESRSFVAEYGTSATAPANLENCVQAGSSDNSSSPRDCESFDSDRVSDLALEKDVVAAPGGAVLPDGAPVIAGETVTYRLVVANTGPSDAVGPISVTDTLPEGFSYVAGSATVGGAAAAPSVNGRDLSWEVLPGGGTLPVAAGGNTITIEFQALIDPAHAPANGVANEATVTGQNDPNPANDTDDARVDVGTEANMTIVKDVAAGPWLAGTDVTYTLTVHNAGSSVAASARVVDALPGGLTMVSMAGADWNCEAPAGGQTGACVYDGSHPVGTSTIEVTAHIGSDLPTAAQANPFVNDASLRWTDSRTYADPDDDPRHDESAASITVTTQADLGLVKTAVDPADDTTEVSSAVAGEQARYRIDVTNYGPSDAAPQLVVTDTLPLGVAYVGPVGTTDADWRITASDYDPAVPQTLTFTRINGGDDSGLPMVGGDPTSAPAILFDVLLSPSLAPTDPPAVPALVNTATVTSGTAEPAVDPHPNTDDASLTVTRSADLEIAKTHPVDANGQVRIDQPLDFTILVRNNGPSEATGVTVTDTIPAGLEVVNTAGQVLLDENGDPTGWTIDSIVQVDPEDPLAGATIVASYAGALGVADPDNAANPLVISTIPRESALGTDPNHAAVSGAETDPDPSNNEVDDPIDVLPRVTLVVQKTAIGRFQVGKPGTYRITVENTGPHDDPGPLTVTDALPAGLTFRSSPQQGVKVDGGTVSWTLDDGLRVGEQAIFTLEVNVGRGAYPAIANAVSVDSPAEKTPDSVLTDTATVKVAAADPLPITGGQLGLMALLGLLLLGGGAALALRDRKRREGAA